MANEKTETNAENETIRTPEPTESKVTKEEERVSEIESIGERLANHPEISNTENQRESDYKREITEAETKIGQPLSEQTKQQIYSNMVSSITEHEKRMTEAREQLEADKKILEYVQETLGGENEKSFIERPIEKDCKVAVIIPAYNESHQDILRSLSSLAGQRGINPSAFEVDVIVNNRKKDAEQQTEAFLANQESIKLIKFINGESTELPEGLTEEQEKQIETIKQSQIRVNAIDKSSLETANEENNVGIARNRAGAEIADRFMTADARREGVIAITDCDCTFSDNYIQTLVQDFEEHKINGLSGNLEFELDPNLTENRDLIQQAFDIYMSRKKSAEDANKYKDEPNFNPDKPDKWALRSGANMAVNVESWCSVGGMPKLSGGEDIRFGKMVGALGKTYKDYGYTITSLIRVSERTGMQSNGRIVKKIKESVDAFVEGKSGGVFIEDRGKVDAFFNGVIEAGKSGSLTGKQVTELMQGCDFKKNRVSEKSYDELAQRINAELTKPEQEWNIKGLEEMISEQIYPYYPERDISKEIRQ